MYWLVQYWSWLFRHQANVQLFHGMVTHRFTEISIIIEIKLPLVAQKKLCIMTTNCVNINISQQLDSLKN